MSESAVLTLLDASCTQGDPSRFAMAASDAAPTQRQPKPDCLECRLIGTGSMLAISGYFAYLSRNAPALQTQSRFTAALSVVFAAAGVARFFA